MSHLLAVWQDLLVSLCVQGSLALLVACILVRSLPGLPPLARVWVLRVALLKALACFLFPVSVISVALPLSKGTATNSFGLIDYLLAVTVGLWLLSAGMSIWRFYRERDALARWLADAEAAPSELHAVMASVAAHLGVRRLPALYLHRGLESPILLRCRRETMVLLPHHLLGRPVELEAAFAHELAHLRHRDLFWSRLVLICNTILFFHPLVVACTKELRLAEECAADSAATSALHLPAGDYSRLLISLVTSAASPGLAMSGAARDLNRRIESMYRARRGSRLMVLIALTLLVATAVPWGVDLRVKARATVMGGDSGAFRAAL